MALIDQVLIFVIVFILKRGKLASLVAQMVKASTYNEGDPGSIPWVGKISWRRKWQPTPGFLPGRSHGWRSLAGYGPWGRKELDATERLHFPSFYILHSDSVPSPIRWASKYASPSLYLRWMLCFVFKKRNM